MTALNWTKAFHLGDDARWSAVPGGPEMISGACHARWPHGEVARCQDVILAHDSSRAWPDAIGKRAGNCRGRVMVLIRRAIVD
jgi:hypothetical protein